MVKKIYSLAVLIIIVFSDFYSNCAQIKWQETYDLAEKAYHDKIYDVAETQLKQIVKTNIPSQSIAKINFLLAKVLYKQNKLAESDKYFQMFSGERENEFREESLFFLIKSSFRQTKFGRSIKYYDRLNKYYPQSRLIPKVQPDALMAQFNLKNYDEAVILCDYILSSSGENQSLMIALFFKIKSLFDLKKYPDTILLCEDFISKYPKTEFSREVLFILAECNYSIKKYSESSKYFDQYLSADKNESEKKFLQIAMLHYARSVSALGDYQKSLEVFDKFQKLYPDSELKNDVLLYCAETAYEAKDFNACVDYLEKYISMRKEEQADSYPLFLYAKSLLELNKSTQAEQMFMKILNMLPDKKMLSEVYYGVGCCKYLNGEYDSGILYFRQSILNSTDKIFIEKCKVAIADSYFERKNYENALSNYKKSLAVEGIEPSLHKKIIFQCALSNYFLKKYDDALKYFILLNDKYPDNEYKSEIKYYTGCIYYSKNQYEKAIAEFTEFADLFPESDRLNSANLICGICYYNISNYDNAIQCLNKIPAMTTLSSQTEYEKGWCYFQKNEDKKAYEQFEVVTRLYPDSQYAPDSVFWLGEYHYNCGDLNKAYEFFKRITDKYPDSRFCRESLYYLSKCAYLKGDYDEAQNGIRQFIKKYPEADLIAESYLVSAQIHLAKKEYQEADNDINLILERNPHSYLIDEVYLIKGNAFFEQKNYTDAINAYLHVADSKDRELAARSLYYAGKSYMELRIGSKGIETMLRVIYSYPDQKLWYYQACFDIAVYYDQREKYDRAKTFYRKLLKAHRGDTILSELIADAKNRLTEVLKKQKN